MKKKAMHRREAIGVLGAAGAAAIAYGCGGAAASPTSPSTTTTTTTGTNTACAVTPTGDPAGGYSVTFQIGVSL